MSLTFPPNPNPGDTYTSGGVTWVYDGVKWTPATTTTTGIYLPLAGGTLTGPLVLSGNATAALNPVPLQQLEGMTSPNDVGRNLLHNSMFRVQQRGAGPWTVTGYTADRWNLFIGASDTDSVSVYTMTDADRAAIGDESAVYGLQNVFVGASATNSASMIQQKVESVRRLSGKTVIFSFWAKASSGTPKLGITATQNYGTGGSGALGTAIGATSALSASWQRYILSASLPSAAGKTLGTAGTDFTNFVITFSDVSNTQGTGIGQQSGTVQIWGVQLEIAQAGQTQPTPLEKPDPRYELHNCQRFYQAFAGAFNAWCGGTSWNFGQAVTFLTQMRASPSLTITPTSPSNVGAGQPTVVVEGPATLFLQTSGAAVGWVVFSWTITASADL